MYELAFLESTPYGGMPCWTLMHGRWAWSVLNLMCQVLVTPPHRRSYPFRGVDSGGLGEQGVRSGGKENCDVMQDKKIK